MFLSVFDMFKIGIGPSSSHTVGPMVAARRFLETAAAASLPRTGRLTVTLHGSLAFTGKGHGTDRAVILGLAGETPADHGPRPGGRGAAPDGGARPRDASRRTMRWPSIRRAT